MAKLPTSPLLLPRGLLPSPSSTLLTRPFRPTLLRARAAPPSHLGPPHQQQQQQPPPPSPQQQVRHATAVARPKRPFTWTQIVQLSDGSTYTARTTSPQPVLRSTRDSRNHPAWQPSDPRLRAVEADEAGTLAGFRQRFGTAFDLAPGAALAAREMRDDAARRARVLASRLGGGGGGGRRRQGDGRKAAAAAAAVAAAAERKAQGPGGEDEAAAAAVAAAAEQQERTEEDVFTDLMTSYVREQPSLKGGQVAAKAQNKAKKP